MIISRPDTRIWGAPTPIERISANALTKRLQPIQVRSRAPEWQVAENGHLGLVLWAARQGANVTGSAVAISTDAVSLLQSCSE